MPKEFKKYVLSILFFIVIISSYSLQGQTPTWTADLTPNGANSLIYRFTKQIWLNPTIILARKEFEATTHVKLLLLPRINNNDTSSNSKLENAFDKVFALLYSDETTRNIKFYFNSQNTVKPFAFATSEELWCKFTPAQKDTVEQLLNKVVATNNNLSDFSKLPFERVIKEASNYCKEVLSSNTRICGNNPQQVFSNININSTPAKLNFEQAPYSGKSTGDVDEQQFDALKAYYNNATDSAENSNYPIAWKAMIANSSEVLKLKVKKNSPSFNLHQVTFKNSGATETYTTQLSTADSTLLNISISGKPAGSMAEVVAYYTTPKTTTSTAHTYPIGALNVQFYERKAPLNVVLVNVGDAAMPNTSAVEEELTKIYGSVFIKWNVIPATCKLSPDLNKKLTIENSGLLSNYPASMQPIIKHFKENCTTYKPTDANTYYLLFGCTNSSGLLGYMPRARNIGFIFDNSPHTIAHELGHGAFNLKHIFSADELGEGLRSQTDNLMDYPPSSGSATKPQEALYKHQWDLIHNPSFVGWFQGDDEEAALASTCTFDAGGKYFIAPNGKPFPLPAGSKISMTSSGYNDGALYGFVKDNKQYIADVQLTGSINSFKGYKNKGINYPAISYLRNAENVHVIFSDKKAINIYSIGSYLAPDNALDDNLNGVENNNHILENQSAFDAKLFIYNCSSKSPPDITVDDFFEKIKSRKVSTNTFFYKDGTLITLSPAKPAEKKACTEQQLNNLKQQIAAGALSEEAAVLFEKTETGYKTTIGFNKSLEAKYGSSPDVKQQCINLLEEKTTAYLKNAKDLTAAATIAEEGTFTDGKKFELVVDQTLYTLVGNVIHDAAKLIQEAQIPENYYNSQNATYSKNWIHSPPLPTGLANGVIEEIKDIPVLVAFGADIAMNANTRHELKEGLKKLTSWEGVKTAASQVVNNWTDKYSNGGDVAWHQAGKDAVGIYSVGKAAAALVGVFKKGVEKEAGNVAEAVGKVKTAENYLENLVIYKQLFKEGKITELFSELKKTTAFPKMGNTRVRNHTDLLSEYKAKYGQTATNYPYSSTNSVTDFELAETGYFVRVYDGNPNKIASKWVFRIEDLRQYINADELMEKLALPTKPTRIAIVEVPENSGLRKSIAGSQDWSNGLKQSGGGVQYELNNSPKEWFRDLISIEEFFK